MVLCCCSHISMASLEALTTSRRLEQAKGAGSRSQGSPAHLREFKNKAVLWTAALVWWSFKIRHKTKRNKPQAADSRSSNSIFPCLGSRTDSFSHSLPPRVANGCFTGGQPTPWSWHLCPHGTGGLLGAELLEPVPVGSPRALHLPGASVLVRRRLCNWLSEGSSCSKHGLKPLS